MTDIDVEIARLGGLAATHELVARGLPRARLRAALHEGRIVRVRHGWYAAAGRHPTLLRAARVGGRASCLTALGLHGFWGRLRRASACGRRPRLLPAPLTGGFPAALGRGRRCAAALATHARAGSRLLADPIEALEDAVRCTSPELAAATVESVLHDRPDLADGVAAVVGSAPRRVGRVLAAVDGSADSGIELLTGWRLRHLGVPIRTQVSIARVGFVEMLVGERLVAEVDGRRYHLDAARFENDRRRDAALSALGFRTLRFSFEQVMSRWGEVEAAVRAAVIRGDHR